MSRSAFKAVKETHPEYTCCGRNPISEVFQDNVKHVLPSGGVVMLICV